MMTFLVNFMTTTTSQPQSKINPTVYPVPTYPTYNGIPPPLGGNPSPETTAEASEEQTGKKKRPNSRESSPRRPSPAMRDNPNFSTEWNEPVSVEDEKVEDEEGSPSTSPPDLPEGGGTA